MKKSNVYEYFNRLIDPHPAEIKDWIVGVDKFLTENGCKIDALTNTPNTGTGVVFTYTYRQNNKRICRIYMGAEGCKAFPYGHHFVYDNSILTELPESMLDAMSYGENECTGCATKRPDLITHSFRYTHKSKSYNKCRRFGFGFSLDNADERELLNKWIEMELLCARI